MGKLQTRIFINHLLVDDLGMGGVMANLILRGAEITKLTDAYLFNRAAIDRRVKPFCMSGLHCGEVRSRDQQYLPTEITPLGALILHPDQARKDNVATKCVSALVQRDGKLTRIPAVLRMTWPDDLVQCRQEIGTIDMVRLALIERRSMFLFNALSALDLAQPRIARRLGEHFRWQIERSMGLWHAEIGSHPKTPIALDIDARNKNSGYIEFSMAVSILQHHPTVPASFWRRKIDVCYPDEGTRNVKLQDAFLVGGKPASVHHAVASTRKGVVAVQALTALASQGVDITSARPGSGLTVLHEFALDGDIEAVRYCLNQGMDPLAKDCRGWTALSHAKAGKNPDVMALLSAHMAQQSVRESENLASTLKPL